MSVSPGAGSKLSPPSCRGELDPSCDGEYEKSGYEGFPMLPGREAVVAPSATP